MHNMLPEVNVFDLRTEPNPYHLLYITSCTIDEAATNSASADERAMTDWRFDFQEIAAPLSIRAYPDVDLRLSGHPAQSE